MKQYELEIGTFYKKIKKIWVTAESRQKAIAFAYGMGENNIVSFDAEQEYPQKEYDSVKFVKEYEIDNKKR